jgi:hypothetical protein
MRAEPHATCSYARNVGGERDRGRIVGRKHLIALDDSAGVRGDTWPQVGALLRNGPGDSRSLHLSLGVHDDTSVVLLCRQSRARLAQSKLEEWMHTRTK